MKGLVGGFGKAFGSALAQSLGMVLVKIVMVFLLVFLILAVLGVLFFGLAIYFYKRKKRKSFLIAGIFSAFSFSLVISIVLSSKLGHDLSLAIVLMPVLFIAGLGLLIFKYRKL